MWVVGKYLTGNKAIYVCIMYNFMCTFCAINEKAKYFSVGSKIYIYFVHRKFYEKKLFCSPIIVSKQNQQSTKV